MVDDLNAALEQWRRAHYAEAALGMAIAALGVQSTAQSTDIFGDDTGATRGSTVAYVVSGDGNFDNSDRADAAFNYAENRNPGSATDDYIQIRRNEIVCALTVFTDYAIDLEDSRGGFIGPTMDSMAGELHNGAMNGIRKLVS